MRASNYHEKEYIVEVDKEITDTFIKKMSGGIHIVDDEHRLNVVTRKCEVKRINKNTFSIVLTQGINRQIRRMCKACGYNVVKLQRIRIMNIRLNGIKQGEYRSVTNNELSELLELLNRNKKFKN